MDLSAEITKQFPPLNEHSGNGVEKKGPDKKVISQEILQANLQGALEMMDEVEQEARNQGYGDDSIVMVFEATLKVLADRIEQLKTGKAPAPATNGSAPAASSEKKQAPAVDERDPLEYIYDFEKFPPLLCKFIGPGPGVIAQGRPLKTWAVEALDKEKTQWLIPQWSIFSEVQNSFLGFQSEDPGKFIYQLTYKGVNQLEGGGIKFMVEILKKFPG
ncbi:MAG: hypothetical protein V4721_16480 [Bacteroidota bacterium]